MPGSKCAPAQAMADSRFTTVNRTMGMSDMPAITGTVARSGARNLPSNTLVPPWRAKCACPRSSNAGYARIGHSVRSRSW